jgi:hypothetical protein
MTLVEYDITSRTITDSTNNRIFKPLNIAVPMPMNMLEITLAKTLKFGCENSQNKISHITNEWLVNVF